MVTMEERINGCMVRSMNGEPFAEDDEDLDAMVAYLTYISEGIPVNADLEWRKINTMEDVPTPALRACPIWLAISRTICLKATRNP